MPTTRSLCRNERSCHAQQTCTDATHTTEKLTLPAQWHRRLASEAPTELPCSIKCWLQPSSLLKTIPIPPDCASLNASSSRFANQQNTWPFNFWDVLQCFVPANSELNLSCITNIATHQEWSLPPQNCRLLSVRYTLSLTREMIDCVTSINRHDGRARASQTRRNGSTRTATPSPTFTVYQLHSIFVHSRISTVVLSMRCLPLSRTPVPNNLCWMIIAVVHDLQGTLVQKFSPHPEP